MLRITCALQLEMQPNEGEIVRIKLTGGWMGRWGGGGNKQKSGSMCVKWVFSLIRWLSNSEIRADRNRPGRAIRKDQRGNKHRLSVWFLVDKGREVWGGQPWSSTESTI